MNKPDGITQDAWDAAKAAAILIFDKLLDDGRIAVISIEARDAAAIPVARAIQSAIEAERERCALISDAFSDAIGIAGPAGEVMPVAPTISQSIRSGK